MVVESISTDITATEGASLFAALADPIRLSIVRQLAFEGPTCVCNLAVDPSTTPNLLSYHLKVLREAGLVTTQRRGRWIDYSLADGTLDRLRSALPHNPYPRATHQMPTQLATPTTRRPGTSRVVTRLALLAAAWVVVFVLNEWVWDAAQTWLGLDPGNRAVEAGHYFLYDVAKLLLLLVGMIFAVGMIRTAINPERVRSTLEGRPLLLALILAAIFGAVTPFCSCSSIPLFIGFVAAGIPLSVTLTFLIASPLVNEVAVVMLGSTFGWGVTGVYVGAGLGLAVLAGLALSRFDLTWGVEAFVFETPVAKLHVNGRRPTLEDRVRAAREEVRDIVGRVWLWVIVGVAIGAAIHGWVPQDFFAENVGADNPVAVPVATLLGVPLYSNAAAAIPIGEALFAKGVALGTVFSFMMATVALSLPEAVMLRRVLKPRLLAIFFCLVTFGIIVIGYTINWIS